MNAAGRTGRNLPSGGEGARSFLQERLAFLTRTLASARELIARLASCDDVGTWTEDDARAWWHRHPVSASRSTARPRDASSLATLSG